MLLLKKIIDDKIAADKALADAAAQKIIDDQADKALADAAAQKIIDDQAVKALADAAAQKIIDDQADKALADAAAQKIIDDQAVKALADAAAQKIIDDQADKALADAAAQKIIDDQAVKALSFKNDDVNPIEAVDGKYVQVGTAGNDTLTSLNNSQHMVGGWVNGGAGNDTIHGHLNDGTTLKTASNTSNAFNSDTLFGGAGDDSINGTLGIDYLIGGSGVDHLWGGLDTHEGKTGGKLVKDVFLFGMGDSGVGAARDVIEDFGSDDLIDFVGVSVVGVTGLNRNLSFIDKPFSAINQVRYDFDFATSTTIVKLNLDNDPKTTEMEIELTGLKFLTADDFVLVKA